MHDNRTPVSTEDWRLRLTEIGKKMGESVSAVGGKITEQVAVVGDRMKEMFHNPTLGERLVEEATNDLLIGPDWGKNLQICDLVNAGQVPGAEVARTIKLRVAVHSKDHVQLLALSLLEMAVKNSVQLFADVANEKVLDEMVRVVDDRSSNPQVRAKCLMLIEAWGEATEELRYLPVYEETYKVSDTGTLLMSVKRNFHAPPLMNTDDSSTVTMLFKITVVESIWAPLFPYHLLIFCVPTHGLHVIVDVRV